MNRRRRYHPHHHHLHCDHLDQDIGRWKGQLEKELWTPRDEKGERGENKDRRVAPIVCLFIVILMITLKVDHHW